jgi:allophanate hydrolase subunit 1
LHHVLIDFESEEEVKVENIIERWVAAARANADLDDLQEGVNISPYQELKIAFDGYAEDEDEFEARIVSINAIFQRSAKYGDC